MFLCVAGKLVLMRTCGVAWRKRYGCRGNLGLGLDFRIKILFELHDLKVLSMISVQSVLSTRVRSLNL